MGNNWELHHFGIRVRDLDKAIEYYESCGIGPWEPEFSFDTSEHPEYKVYGKTPPSPYKARGRLNKAGPIVLEMGEILEGGHIHEEFLEKHGEGVKNIGYVVDDLDKEIAKLVEKGFPVVISATTKSGSRYAYFDTRKFGKFYLQLLQMSEEDRLMEEEEKIKRKENAKTGNSRQLHHLGIAVRDLDKAVEYYESCGMGPFEPEVTIDISTYPEYRVYGKPPVSPLTEKATLNKTGPILLELFQPLKGGHIHKEWSEKHGEGVEHIAYLVDDLAKETAELAAKGFPVVVSATTKSGTQYAILDTRKHGNIYLGLLQISEEDRLKEGKA